MSICTFIFASKGKYTLGQIARGSTAGSNARPFSSWSVVHGAWARGGGVEGSGAQVIWNGNLLLHFFPSTWCLPTFYSEQ